MMNSPIPSVLAAAFRSKPAMETMERHGKGKFHRLKVVAWPAFRFRDKNPYQFLLYSHMLQLGACIVDATPKTLLREHYDIFHIHWPDYLLLSPSSGKSAFKMAGFLIIILLLKLRGTKIVWTVHNLAPHESQHPWLARVLWRWFPGFLDGFIAMTEEAVPAARKAFPSLRGKPFAMIPHGHYRGYYKDDLSRAEAREALGMPPGVKAILFFGLIRPYKNLAGLIKAFRKIEGSDVRLVVAGDLPEHLRNSKNGTEIHSAVSSDDRILLHLRHIEDDDIQAYFKACDIVVLPYASVLNSGAAILALSFDRPVLLPNMGAMPELQKVVGEEWVHLYSGELRARDIVRCLESTASQLTSSPSFESLEWDRIAASTREFFGALSSPRGKPA